MPCLEESELPPKENDVALEILDIVTPRHNIGEPQVVREISQTDRLNKILLKSLIDRMNIIEPVSNNSMDAADEFED